jgi:hypothetical protein
MSLNFWLRNIVLHAGSAVAAAGFGSVPDVISNMFQGPTGGAAQYASNHPIVGLLYAAIFGIAREALKGVSGVAPQSATTVGPNAPTALGTANVKS